MSITAKMLLTQKDVVARIVKLGANATEVQAEIHLIGCSTLDHIRVHGDTTGAVALMNALPNGQRVKSLSFWYRHFTGGKVSMIFADKAWSCNLGKNRTDANFDIKGAMATTFADLTSERDPVTLVVEKFIKNLERTANNAEKHDGTQIDKVDPAVRQLAAQLVAYVREKGLGKTDSAAVVAASEPVEDLDSPIAQAMSVAA